MKDIIKELREREQYFNDTNSPHEAEFMFRIAEEITLLRKENAANGQKGLAKSIMEGVSRQLILRLILDELELNNKIIDIHLYKDRDYVYRVIYKLSERMKALDYEFAIYLGGQFSIQLWDDLVEVMLTFYPIYKDEITKRNLRLNEKSKLIIKEVINDLF